MELHYGRMTSKGQITIPAAIRKRLELEPGVPVLFKVLDDGQIRVSSPVQDLTRHFGTMPLPPGVTGTDLAARGEEIWAADAIARDRRWRGLVDEAVEEIEAPSEQDAAAIAR